MKRILIAFLLIVVVVGFKVDDSLQGSWQYCGGIYNGKPEAASKDYTLQRNYDAAHYSALLIEKGQPPYNYERGDYRLNQDTCMETQTFNAEPSKLLNVTIKYQYKIKNDTLTFNGVLPNGTVVLEKWRKVK
ncbi:hypothetical protein ACFQZI_08630 [Mucilaginibacter lutimaris]|uniref:Lipocalin-like domain-containing protein n=1 Tax=Mucilaginibacter lutimaris TaxID=931629 RepID=A0ABW2ZFD2_9SPHI